MSITLVSTVGTSLLTNLSRGNEALQKSVFRHTNSAESNIPPNDLAAFREMEVQLVEQLTSGGMEAARRASAELNGLFGVFGSAPPPTETRFVWIATDTYLGAMAARILEAYLRAQGHHAQWTFTPEGLNTRNREDFLKGVKKLLRWFDDDATGFKSFSGQTEVVFNLTGGFKSLQGCMNTIGMFYADRIVYIFESSDELLEIPRLPLQIDVDTLREHALPLAQMAQDQMLKNNTLRGIPEALLENIGDGECVLSEWGDLVWLNAQRFVLSEKLLPFKRLVAEKSFIQDFNRIGDARIKVDLQKKLAKADYLMEASGGDLSELRKDGGILYENYINRFVQGAPLGHFRINLEYRVSCVYRDGKLHLRFFGTHDHIYSSEGMPL